MNEQTVHKLRDMRLFGFTQGIIEQNENRSYHDLSFEERFAFLVDKEYLRRQNLRLHNRLKEARLKTQAALSEVDFKVQRGLSKNKFLDLAQLNWMSSKHNLIILGPTGVGKTFLSSVLADQACKLGFSARYYKTSELVLDINTSKADGSFKNLISRLNKTSLLILDEWLRDPLSSDQARDILDLIDDRYRKNSCIFATQIPVQDWHSHIPEPTLADAILDRVAHDSLRLELAGESMRKITSNIAKTND